MEDSSMNYIYDLLSIIPVIIIISGIIYFAVYKINCKKRTKPTKNKMFAELLLIGWIVMFLYITQIMSFGNSFGAVINFEPLRPFFMAFRYGSNNARMVWQILLNILMFAPLGFLLPIVFPKKCKNFLIVFATSFAFSFSTEILQLLTSRGADIDDLISNTLGGILGFALYVICYGIYFQFLKNQKKSEISIKRYKLNLIISFVVILTIAAPFVALRVTDTMSEFGNIYYGHLRPADVVVADSISDEESTAVVYQYVEKESLHKLQKRLLESTGFSGEFLKDNNIYSLQDGDEKMIFIYDHNQWNVTYNYGLISTVDTTKLPSKNKAISLSYSYLENFGVSPKEVVFQGIDDNYNDEYIHLVFANADLTTTNKIVWGTLSLTLGEDGKLLEISDNRIYCEHYKDVPTISPKTAISVALNINRGTFDFTATVHDVKPSFYFNADTDFLIPTWEIQGTYNNGEGKVTSWNPNIDAIK